MTAPTPSSPHGLDCSSGGISSCGSGGSETPKSVGFSTVEIREFPRVLGDNPAVTCGPPVTLDWGYDPSAVHQVNLDRYEESKPPPREKSQMLVPRQVREGWLMDAGFPRSEVAAAVRDVNRAKARRNRTVHNANLSRFHIAAESLRRKIGRVVLRREHDSSLYRKWAEEEVEGGGGGTARRTRSAPASSMQAASQHARSWQSTTSTALDSSSSSAATTATPTEKVSVEGGPVIDVEDRRSSAPESLLPRGGWNRMSSCPGFLSLEPESSTTRTPSSCASEPNDQEKALESEVSCSLALAKSRDQDGATTADEEKSSPRRDDSPQASGEPESTTGTPSYASEPDQKKVMVSGPPALAKSRGQDEVTNDDEEKSPRRDSAQTSGESSDEKRGNNSHCDCEDSSSDECFKDSSACPHGNACDDEQAEEEERQRQMEKAKAKEKEKAAREEKERRVEEAAARLLAILEDEAAVMARERAEKSLHVTEGESSDEKRGNNSHYDCEDPSSDECFKDSSSCSQDRNACDEKSPHVIEAFE